MDMGLRDRVAVVTGGSSGIGYAAAAALLREGAKVAICGRGQDKLDAAAAALAKIAGADRVLAHACNVLDEAEVAALRDAVAEKFGRCDVLVCNAGQSRQSNLFTTSDQDWRDEFELKFFSVLRPVRAFLAMLEASGQGAVVCTGAILARHPEPFLIATSATRAGQLNLNKSMSVELAERGIRVNTVLIGLVDSGQWSRRFDAGVGPDNKPIPKDMSKDEWFADLARARKIPLARLGRPEEAANAILFLSSPMSSYVTGETIEVTGGQSRHV
jgi:NAD(P)-dependent dehydrogenase (short-subunit alcohol dehydrogenase family)